MSGLPVAPHRTALPRLLRLMGAIVAHDVTALETLRKAAPEGEPDVRWREVALMAHLFCGFPRTLAALEVLGRAGGLGAPEPVELEASAGPGEDVRGRGAALFERIYGANSSAVRAHIDAQHPDLERWIAEHAYGRVLSRPALDAATRELCAVVALAVTGHDRQLASHARGAIRCGATRADVDAALALVEEWIPEAAQARVRTVIEQFAR
ncbi:MAG: carboxymuconolactone decarboxylase family protein [Planctomycetota bacterium]